MKTGMVRRIDELGRIVIPKEIRRNLKLNMGDIVEIYVEDNKIFLKRFSTLLGLEEDLFNIAKVINEQTGASVLFIDQDKIIVSYGKYSEHYLDKEINPAIYNKINNSVTKLNNQNIVEDYLEERNHYCFSLEVKGLSHGLFIIIENDTPIGQNELQSIIQFKKFIIKQLDT